MARWLLRVTQALFALLCLSAPLMAEETSGWFRLLDRNKDGKVTRDEVPEKQRPLFDRIDANHDGVVTSKENKKFASRHPSKPAAAVHISDAIHAELNLPYVANNNPRQQLDLYLPKHPKTDKPLPLVVFIHGGGWQMGDKRNGYDMVASYVESGEFAGASIGYRLSQEAIWPAQIYDCKAGIRWLRANAKKYNLDADHIGVSGVSAGGHLVAMLGTSGDVASLEGDLGPNKGVSSRVACVVVQCGPTDLPAMAGLNRQVDGMFEQLLGGPIKQKAEAARSASPITYVTKDDPPFMLVQGTLDPLVPFHQAELLQESLQKEGVETLLITMAGAGHAAFYDQPEAGGRMRQFFCKHLLGRGGSISTEPVKVGPRPLVKK